MPLRCRDRPWRLVAVVQGFPKQQWAQMFEHPLRRLGALAEAAEEASGGELWQQKVRLPARADD